jgi:hypothetical protein
LTLATAVHPPLMTSSDTGRISWLRPTIVIMAAMLLALALRPTAHVYDMPMTEDGYYALSVARNVAAGRGITIDGTTLTNGFQPLFTMLEAGAFWLAQGNETLAMRLVMALGWLFHLGGALVVALIARDAWPSRRGAAERDLRSGLAAFLYLAAPLMLNHAYNGLETGCVLFFYALAARWMQTWRDYTWLGLAGFGIIIGLLVLARIDTAFVAVALGLNELRRARAGGVAHMIRRGAVLGGAAVLVSSPWWLYNTLYFGSPMPTSGAAQQALDLDWLRFEYAEWALRVVLVPWLFAGAHEGDLALNLPIPEALDPEGYMTLTAIGFVRTVVVVTAALVLWRAWRRGTLRADLDNASAIEDATTRRTLEFAACFGLAYVGLLAYYTLAFTAYWFYYRYFAPIALVAFVVTPLLLARAAANAGPRFAVATLVTLLAFQCAGLIGFAFVGRGLGGNTVYHDQVALVRKYVPKGAEVAAGQSGTLGFFLDHVVNTDGKVNRDAIDYQDHMWDYLRERGVRWFVDWPPYVNRYLGVPFKPDTDVTEPSGNGWQLRATQNYFYLYEYTGPLAR